MVKISTKRSRTVRSSEILFRYLWIFAIVPKMVQFVFLLIMAFLFLKEKRFRIRFEWTEKLILAYAAVHIASIVRCVLLNDVEFQRVLAGINTFSIWIIAIVFFSKYRGEYIPLKRFGKYCFQNSLILITLALLSRVLVRFGRADTYIFLGRTLTSYAAGIWDYRFSALLDYPTMVVGFALMMYPGTIYFLEHSLSKGYRWVSMFFYHSLLFVPIYYSFSRSGYVLFSLIVLGFLAVHAWRMIGARRMFVAGLVILLVCLGNIDSIIFYGTKIAEKLLSMREGSNAVRMMIYEGSWKLFKENPVIGYGVKIVGPAGYPLGSHCTYIGFLYKTGIFGTVFIGIAFFHILSYTVRNARKRKDMNYWILTIMFFIMMAFFIFEDMDGTDWQLCMWLSLLGIAVNPFLAKTKNCLEWEMSREDYDEKR